jgi:hypothetical protein
MMRLWNTDVQNRIFVSLVHDSGQIGWNVLNNFHYGCRIVTVSALAHEAGQIYWDDLNLKEKGAYGPIRAYIQSKIANILFSAELGTYAV